MPQEINDHYIKITDKAYIDEPLQDECEYQIEGVIETDGFTDKGDKDNPGKRIITYKAKFVRNITLQRGGQVIRLKDKGSESKKLRGAIWHLQDEVERKDIDEEVFYKAVQGMIRGKLREIYERYKSELNFN